MMPSKPIWPETQPFTKSSWRRIGPGAIAMERFTPKPKSSTYWPTQRTLRHSEKLSELKVHVYGNAAVATYKDTYDIMIMGEHRAHTIIATDTFVKTGDEWKQVASHGAEAK